MAQETKHVASKEKHFGHKRPDEITLADDEIEEIEISQKQTLNDKVTQVMEKFARTRLGQFITERTDRVLKVVEDTAKWSLPQDKGVQLERPLPWMLFITLIVWLRVLRIGLSVANMMVGSARVTPQSMVYYIQIKRRHLRAIRVNGLKSIRSREHKSTVMNSGASGKKVTFVGKLRTLFGSAICKPGQHRDVPSRRAFVPSGNDGGSKDMPERSSKRPRDDDSADLNLTVDEMLNKYANEDSDADSDYIPKDGEMKDSTSSDSTSSSSDETDNENIENSNETPKESEKSSSLKNDNTPIDQSVVEIKENGDGTQTGPMPKPLLEIKLEPLLDVDSSNEQVQTPRENGESGQPTESGVAATEVAQQKKTLNTSQIAQSSTQLAAFQEEKSIHTPKITQNRSQLAVPQVEEDQQKSTPGHQSAASLKPLISTTATAVPKPLPNDIRLEKCYRTITTQTCIEFDWSITVKTEISHIKTPPKLEKLDCSIQLTPASSTEDVFYSPIGTPQDFHSIFHPAPIVKVSPVDAHSTPKDDERTASSSAETSELAAGNQKKPFNNSNYNKQNQYHNAKNRNKNRR